MSNAPCCTERKECSFAHGRLQTYNLAEQIVMTDTWFLRFHDALKHFMRSDGINKIRSSKYYYLCMSVSLPYVSACKEHLLCVVLYCHMWPVCLSVRYFFTSSHKRHDFIKKIVCVQILQIFSTNFVKKTSHSQKN